MTVRSHKDRSVLVAAETEPSLRKWLCPEKNKTNPGPHKTHKVRAREKKKQNTLREKRVESLCLKSEKNLNLQ